MANLTYRSIKGSPLTNDELDNNFSYFTGSFTNTGTITAIGFSGSFTGSLSGSITGTATNALTASYVTASNVIGMVSSASYALTSNPFPFIGNATFSGSVLVSGSIVPNVPAGSSTSSFSLGSPTAAWKDIYVSNGTINFLNSAGQVQSTLGTGNNQLTGDTFIDGKLRQGEATLASGSFSHAEGSYSTTLGYASHAEGTSNTGLYAWDTTSTTNGLIQLATSVGNITSSFPNGTPILLDNLGTIYKYAVSNSFFAASRTQIQLTNTSVNYGTNAVISLYSQTQSPSTQLNNQTQILGGNIAHSEGSSTIALGSYSHAEGELNTALGYASHVEGNGTISQGDYQHVQGLYNITSSTAGAFILGNGTDDSNRKNLIFAAGNNVQISGSLLVSGSVNSNDFDSYFNLVRVGQGPITGAANTILGETALNSATAGAANNTAIGNTALFANTTGLNNTIVGAGTALSNITGSRNTALGAAALLLHNSDDNTAIGWNSLLGITSGYRNTALGTAAGNNVSSTSFGNVYIGFNAGPTSSLVENNKLYINNTSSVTPLIGGDFSTGVATINSILQLQRRTTNPGSPIEGMIMASGSAGSSKLFYYNGSAWVDLTA
jgi:hypothetical protein